jgi:predicted aspartyl protease
LWTRALSTAWSLVTCYANSEWNPYHKMEFELADGSVMEREIDEVRFRLNGRRAVSTVIFGQEKDAGVLGVVTLEAMGLEIDPVRKQPRPMRMVMY